MSKMTPTLEEQKAIVALKRIAQKWPSTAWIFASDGILRVLRCGPTGEQKILLSGGWAPITS